MSVTKWVKSLLVATMVLVSMVVVAKSANVDFQKEIAKLSSAVDGAMAAGQINDSERASLKSELTEIKGLYDLYMQDNKITAKESKTLNTKLKKSDLNLFRKKYD